MMCVGCVVLLIVVRCFVDCHAVFAVFCVGCIVLVVESFVLFIGC